jgi:hypothetical protein
VTPSDSFYCPRAACSQSGWRTAPTPAPHSR